MRTIWTVARYDLLRSMKERETFLIGLLMPGLMIFLLGIAISSSSPTITIDVIDLDDSALSVQFVTLLHEEMGGEDDPFFVCDYANPDDGCSLDADLPDQPDEWRRQGDERLGDTNTFGVVIIEPGFGARLEAGEPATVVFKNSNDLSAPTLARQKIDAAATRLGSAIAIADLTLRVAEENFAAETFDRSSAFAVVQGEVEKAWANRPVHVNQQSTQERAWINGFNQSGPGMATMFVLMFMLNSATMLVYERETGTLQRLFTLPVRRSHILAGKILGRYLYGLGIFTVLVLVGAWMGVEWGSNAIGIVLIMLTFTLAATALGLALSTVVRTSAQAENISLLMGLTLAPLGGAWWPIELVPRFMQQIGHISPIAWAMDAFQELIWYDGTLVDIAPMLGVLLAMAAAFFTLGVSRLRYE